MTKNQCLIKEGGQSKVVKRKTGIYKVFKNIETYKRENQIHMCHIQPLNQMHVYSPFVEVYPSENVSESSAKPQNEFKMKRYLYDYSEYMKSNPRSTELKVKLDFLQMAYSVYCLHQNNIYHGDIKPDNFLVNIDTQDDFVEIKLADFGGAEKLSSRNDLIYLPLCYTQQYHPYDLSKEHPHYNPFQVDCYALGVVLDKMSSHLQRSKDLLNQIILLKSQSIQIEDIFCADWIYKDITAQKLIKIISQKTSQFYNNSQFVSSSSFYPQQIQAGFQYYSPYYYPSTQIFVNHQQNLMGRYQYPQQPISSNQLNIVDNDSTSFTFIN